MEWERAIINQLLEMGENPYFSSAESALVMQCHLCQQNTEECVNAVLRWRKKI